MKGDLKKLQGTWTIVAVEVEGRAMPGGSKIVLEGERFTTVAMGNDYGGTVDLNSGKSPKTFDLLFTSGPHKGMKSLGIYELDGDTWRICVAFAGIKTRPKEFAATPGSGFALETLKRGDVSAPAEEASEADAGPGTELEGEWAMVSGSFDGHAMEASLVKLGRRIARGRQITVMFGPQVYMKARVTLDSSKSPKQIDYAIASEAGSGSTQSGIYELEGKSLNICMAAVGQARPSDFTSSKGDGRTLTLWKPVKLRP
jgi:uncharacterized protein (TIGR03067 family)